MDIQPYIDSLASFVSGNMTWLVALVPLLACFVSNWMTMGISTYFRIHPAVCMAPLATFITQALITFAIAFGAIALSTVATGSLLPANRVMNVTAGLGMIHILVLTMGEYSARFEGILGWAYSAGCIWATIWSFMYDPFAAPGLPAWIGGVGDDALGVFAAVLFSRFSVGACVLSLADAIAFILQLCVLAYIAGVYYAEHREPRLVDAEYREIVLWVFAGGTCVTAPILDVRFEEDVDPSLELPVCVVSNRRLYRHLSDFKDGLVWARFSKLDLNRSNAEISS